MKELRRRARTDADGADRTGQTWLGDQHAAFERPNL